MGILAVHLSDARASCPREAPTSAVPNPCKPLPPGPPHAGGAAGHPDVPARSLSACALPRGPLAAGAVSSAGAGSAACRVGAESWCAAARLAERAGRLKCARRTSPSRVVESSCMIYGARLHHRSSNPMLQCSYRTGALYEQLHWLIWANTSKSHRQHDAPCLQVCK